MTRPLAAPAFSHDGFDLLVRNLVMKPGVIFRRGDPRTLEERLDFITESVAAANREALSKAPRNAIAQAVSTAMAELPPWVRKTMKSRRKQHSVGSPTGS